MLIFSSSVEPFTDLQQGARPSTSSSASRVCATAFPSSSQGLFLTNHHPNACTNNTENLFCIFDALESAENISPKADSHDLKDGPDRFWEAVFLENINLYGNQKYEEWHLNNVQQINKFGSTHVKKLDQNN